MRILYATDHKNYLVSGRVYLTSRIFPIIKRYADVFGKVILYSRLIHTETLPEDGIFADFIEEYIEEKNPVKTLLLADDELKSKVKEVDMVIGRVPAIPAYKAVKYAMNEKTFTYSEACGCAWDAYWNHGVLGKILAPYMYFKMKEVMRKTDFASYVTDSFLQKRYPRRKSSVAVSNVVIKSTNPDIITTRINKINENASSKVLTLMTTAAVNVRYKGQEYVIKAIPKINAAGIKVKYYIVGDGDQSYLRTVAKQHDVLDQVEFTGKLPRECVFSMCDKADIYIQPSLQEGLPRAMIEAMSRACIAIGAKTAGIPELVESEYVVRRKSSDDIANKVIQIAKFDRSEWIKICRRNFEKACEFSEDKLSERRNTYYYKVKETINNSIALRRKR